MNKKIELMTYDEFYETINPRHMRHSSNSYNYNVETYQNDKPNNYKKFIKRFYRGNLEFEIREREFDAWEHDYYKKDDNGNYLRDENNKLISLTQKEKEKLINPRYSYEYAVIDVKDKKIIARTQDEWGCLLITVASEYRGLGIGDLLFYEHNKKYPFRESGGVTADGEALCYRYYQNKISQYLMDGGYTRSYRKGEISIERVKEILISAKIDRKNLIKEKEKYKNTSIVIESAMEAKKRRLKSYLEKDLDMSDSSDYLLHMDNNFAILYNKKVFDNIKNDEFEEYFLEKGCLGFVYVGGVYSEDAVPKLFSLHGVNKNIKKFMIEVAFNMFVDEPVRVHEVDKNLLNDNILGNSEIGNEYDGFTEYTLIKKTIKDLNDFGLVERFYRKNRDIYGEKFVLLHEKVEGLSKDINERIKENLEYEENNKKSKKIKIR